MSKVLGIDVGGSGIKGAPVDLEIGDFAEPRLRILTPEKSSPKNVVAVLREIVDNFTPTIGDGPVGISFPAPASSLSSPTSIKVGPVCTRRTTSVTLWAAR